MKKMKKNDSPVLKVSLMVDEIAEEELMIQDVVNIELCECSRRNPRRSAKHAYHSGTFASSIAHAGICFRNSGPSKIR